jgi:hypothetical protein
MRLKVYYSRRHYRRLELWTAALCNGMTEMRAAMRNRQTGGMLDSIMLRFLNFGAFPQKAAREAELRPAVPL